MEEDGIGLVLARATELRMKISNCVDKVTGEPAPLPNGIIGVTATQGDADDEESASATHSEVNEKEDEDGEVEDAERLLNICDALESLENQLSSLQALQQQWRYEREVALTEIENSRKLLIDKLKEYKGKELEVIHEATNFASETVEQNNDLMLPPYPSHPPCSICLENGYLAQAPPTHKHARNGLIKSYPSTEANKTFDDSEKLSCQNGPKSSGKGLGFFISSAAKTMLSLVGIATILRMSGVGPKRSSRFNILDMFQREIGGNSTAECPPGKMPVMENGEIRCVVKERVEVPFSALAVRPDINYCCG